jgi:hypothetical protein
VKGFFDIGVLGTICPAWLWTVIFLISASWVARIIGVSHWRPGPPALFCVGYFSDRVSRIICLGLTSNHDPSDL